MKLDFVAVKSDYVHYASAEALASRISEETGIQDYDYLIANMPKYITREICDLHLDLTLKMYDELLKIETLYGFMLLYVLELIQIVVF